MSAIEISQNEIPTKSLLFRTDDSPAEACVAPKTRASENADLAIDFIKLFLCNIAYIS